MARNRTCQLYDSDSDDWQHDDDLHYLLLFGSVQYELSLEIPNSALFHSFLTSGGFVMPWKLRIAPGSALMTAVPWT